GRGGHDPGRAQARDKVKRNVVLLCEVPRGKAGRPSESLTVEQAAAVLDAARNTSMYAYIVLSLVIGARTEELRALTWAHVDLEGLPDAEPPVPPSIRVWRSVRAGGKTKTKSRRTLALPKRCAEALRFHASYRTNNAKPPVTPGRSTARFRVRCGHRAERQQRTAILHGRPLEYGTY